LDDKAFWLTMVLFTLTYAGLALGIAWLQYVPY
jgi:hypothetical protein